MTPEQTKNRKLLYLKMMSVVTGLLVPAFGILCLPSDSIVEYTVLIYFGFIALGILTIRIGRSAKFTVGVILGTVQVVIFSCGCLAVFFLHGAALAEKEVCHDQMQSLSSVCQGYCKQNEGILPGADIWCDQLLESVEDAEHDHIIFVLTKDSHHGYGEDALARRRYNRYGDKKVSPYAFNRKLDRYRLADIDRQTVLLFKSGLGWNQHGTSGTLSPYGHLLSAPFSEGGYNFVLVGPGSTFTVEFVKYSEIDDLNWEPAK